MERKRLNHSFLGESLELRLPLGGLKGARMEAQTFAENGSILLLIG
jgi:hypothetical protein